MIMGGIELAGGEKAIAERMIERGVDGSTREIEAVERRFGPYASHILTEVLFYDHCIANVYQADVMMDALRYLAGRAVRNTVRSSVAPDLRWEDGFSAIS